MPEFTKPGLTEILGEARIVGEYLRFSSDVITDHAHPNAGANRRSVLLIPGFFAGDATLFPLGARLGTLGHRAFYSGIWINADCPGKTLDRLQLRLRHVSEQAGGKVVLIGHSLGGIYARELARREPGRVEHVFLLGSPVKHAMGSNNATPFLRPLIAAFKLIHSRCLEGVGGPCTACGRDLPEQAPEVPETVIYTRTDGIVDWRSCIDTGPQVECVEVDSSHCGIPLNRKTWDVIAATLSQPSAQPRPLAVAYRASACRERPPQSPRVTDHLRVIDRVRTAGHSSVTVGPPEAA